MKRFSDHYKRGELVDNRAASQVDKVDIRRRVLNAIGADRASVFDAFAGSGKMHRAVWREAAFYTGCDRRFFFDRRRAYVADNELVLRVLDLGQFNVFDLDAYGSPWEQAAIIAARRKAAPGERIGLVLTEGSGIRIRFGGLPHSLAEMTGIPMHAAGGARDQHGLIDAGISAVAERMGCRVERRWEAKGRSGARVFYIGLVLAGLAS